MARVAKRAGVSVGSLYQYFPNKAAILFRLQSDEWRQTTALLRDILDNAAEPPATRLRSLVHAFIQSECDEAAVRVALSDAAPLYRDAPAAKAVRASSEESIEAFMREALPHAAALARERAGDLVMGTLSAMGKQFSQRPRSPREVRIYADDLADMLCAYLDALANARRAPSAR